MTEVKSDLKVIKTYLKNMTENYATKTELKELENTMIKWVVGANIGLVAAVFAIAAYFK